MSQVFNCLQLLLDSTFQPCSHRQLLYYSKVSATEKQQRPRKLCCYCQLSVYRLIKDSSGAILTIKLRWSLSCFNFVKRAKCPTSFNLIIVNTKYSRLVKSEITEIFDKVMKPRSSEVKFTINLKKQLYSAQFHLNLINASIIAQLSVRYLLFYFLKPQTQLCRNLTKEISEITIKLSFNTFKLVKYFNCI
ncbi:Hypothetical_protein [Hexamita inflata]|uniref:Hypothetical_protein n=1 Tax=Hexamita inflata TaxID=28002 RepID=A0AA86U5S4_9EUKA|nr:Hypothetical protein HINF_LOCUS29684 [Hexamita inflata]